jgi:protein strawberry notch
MDGKMNVSKEAYEQNYQQFRSLNQIMWQIPVLAMTLTGGLWFGVSTIDNNAMLVTILLLTAVIPTNNERIYRVTAEGCASMIGRTLSEEGAAALRARFLTGTPTTPQEMLTAALGSTAPVDLGRGLTLTRRRVAGAVRLEIDGADRGAIDGLKALGCFTENIAFQLRVFMPHGEGVETAAILGRIAGGGARAKTEWAA